MSSLFPPEKIKRQPHVIVEELPAYSNVKGSQGWKPLTFGLGILGPVICATAALIATIAILQWQTARNGALFFASTPTDFSNLQNFLYQYLPTIIIVVYGMFWSWIDLDVRRLEPWMQLSRDGGACAEKSLLLHYPVDFLPLVPLKAARRRSVSKTNNGFKVLIWLRRQWAVSSASFIMVLVTWAIIPLQNGIFTNGVLNLSSNTSIQASTALLSISEQTSRLTGGFLNEAFSIIWLKQQLPAYTTEEFALAPFLEISSATGANRTITTNTTLYQTELVCKPPAKTMYDTTPTVTFDDGNGCIASGLISYPDAELDDNFVSYYVGYYDDPNTDISLQLAGCGLNAAHTFLAIWKVASSYRPDFSDPSNATALFCTPVYYSQSVEATVAVPGYAVIETKPLQQRRILTDDFFNTTQFEYILSNGLPPNTPRMDIADDTVLHQDDKLSNMSLASPASNMVAFAIGLTQLSPSDYLDPQNLQGAIQAAHQLLFAIAMKSVMAPINSTSKYSGVANSTFQTIQLVPIFAILSQVFLAVVAAFGCHLIYCIKNRKSNLTCNPDSLAEIMRLGRHPQIRNFFNRCDSAVAERLSEMLESSTLMLTADSGHEDPVLCFKQDCNDTRYEFKAFKKPPSKTQRVEEVHKIQPLEYRWYLGVPFVTVLLASLTSLVYLHQKSVQENGLPLPSNNIVVQQILLNIIPTSISTLIEPIWVLLNRLACILQPMEELRHGNTSAKKSLLLQYTSLPPQLVAWRAFRAGHFILGTLSCVALLANLLTVALSGLFTIQESYQTQTSFLKPVYQPQLRPVNDSSFVLGLNAQNDPFFVATVNFSLQTPLPAWTGQHEYFLPLTLDSKLQENKGLQYQVETTGYAAEIICEELFEGTGNKSYQLAFNNNATRLSVITSHAQPDGSFIHCKPSSANENVDPATQAASKTNDGKYLLTPGDPQGRKALEITSRMASIDSSSDAASFCTNLIVQGWIRASINFENHYPPESFGLLTSMNLSSTFVTCQPRQKQANFDLTISPEGSVIKAVQKTPFTYQISQEANFSSVALQNNLNIALVPQQLWHDDTVATDWINYLVKEYSGSTALLDAELPPPNFNTVANLTGEVFSRTFAIQMALMADSLISAPIGSPPILAQIVSVESRVFMSEPLYKISITILALDLLVAAIFYATRPSPFLPRLPVNLASQIAYFAGSHVIDDVQRAGGTVETLDKKGYRYGYGRYIGWDGWTHVGVERAPYVTKIEDSGYGWLRRRRGREREVAA